MPDHFHGFIVLDGGKSTPRVDYAGATSSGRRRPNGPLPGSLGAVLAAFRTGTTNRMNQLRGTPGQRYWQRGFHDWRIRPTHPGEFERIAQYIAENPMNWK